MATIASTPGSDRGISADAQSYIQSRGQHSSMAAVTARDLPDADAIGDAELLTVAQERFRRSASADSAWRDRATKELDFADGLEHWDDKARQGRENLPCMVFDLIGPKIDQVVNDARQAPPEAKFSPVGSGSDKEEAKMLQGLMRNIDNDSGADTARLTAFEYAVKIGRGWWREDFEWETEDDEPSANSFYQKLATRRIANPFCVYPDPSASEFDYSDMMWCFVTEDIDKDTFDELYGDVNNKTSALSGNFEGVGDPIKSDWFPNGAIRVAEYFWIEIDRSYLYLMNDGRAVKFEDLKEGEIPVMKRVVQKRTVNWAKMSGLDVLERKKWQGKWIPVVGVVGKEILKEGKRTQTGMIRPVIDANKSYDYMRSKECQAIGLAPISQWLVAEGSIENHEWKYADSNRKAFAYLEYKTRDAEGNPCPPPQRINAGVDTAGISQAIAHASQDVMTGTNVYAPDTGAPVPDQSGKAIGLRVRQADNAHFAYADNLARSTRHAARIRLGLIPYIYSENRIITITDPDGKVRAMRINGKPQADDNLKQAADKIIDLKKIPRRMDVVIGSGPGYATQRQEGFAQAMQMAQADPTIIQKAGDIIIRASDAPYADEIADRLAPPGMAGNDGPPIPPAVQAQLQQGQQVIAALTKQVHLLVDEKDQKQLELASKERIAAGDRAARIEIATISARAMIEAAALKAKTDAANTLLDQNLRVIENLQEGVETAAQRDFEQRQAQDDREHEQYMAAQAAAQNPPQQGAPGAGSPPAQPAA